MPKLTLPIDISNVYEHKTNPTEENMISNIDCNSINIGCCIYFAAKSFAVAAAALFDINNVHPVKCEIWL